MRFPLRVLQTDYPRWQEWVAEHIGEKNQDWSVDTVKYEEKDEAGRVWASGANPFIVIDDEKKAFLYALVWNRH